MSKYIIPEITAQSILSAGGYFDATDPSRQYEVTETRQDDCAMFYQAMELMKKQADGDPCRSLYDVFVYVNFSGVFDRTPMGRVREWQAQAERLFQPEGIWLNFGGADQNYIAFERSASMSRNNRLAFVRADLYEPLRERMMLGMEIGACQLSKLYAYNALLFTSGRRHADDLLLYPERIVVIDNPKSLVPNVPVITVEDDGTNASVRHYHRVEKTMDVEVLEFDGEGLISKELAHRLDDSGRHDSFQIRLPYIKGVVHAVGYKELFRELGVSGITDLWGNQHDVSNVDMILTKSMFKGFGWMTENGMTWAEYLERCRKYGHALYISGQDKLQRQEITELNYQFLTTLAITEEEFRPADLPLGWDHSPAEDTRHWLTKATETAYYDYAVNHRTRLAYFLRDLDDPDLEITDRRRQRAALLQKNPLFLEESIFAGELRRQAESVLKQYSLGQLLVSGDNRYLSDDLMRLLYILTDDARLEAECLSGNQIYAPRPAYSEQDQYTLLRSPHIARNEEVLAIPMKSVGPYRQKYLSHLSYVLMVDSRSLIPERLGGADYDGDMIKTVADPMLNECVQRSHGEETPPLLKIPAAEPLISDATDWKARFETVKSTFSSRVGQISNAALRRGVIAYDENTDDAEKQKCREETEVLAILTGLEIDSAKSGIKPDLSLYLDPWSSRRSLFLRYKAIVGGSEDRKWYEPTKNARLKEFFSREDWDHVSSNLEKLPYYAWALGKETPAHKAKPAEDKQLFAMAEDPEWKGQLDPALLSRMTAIIDDYETAIRRCRYLRGGGADLKRKNDIRRILFARGQEEQYDVDALYAAFDRVHPLDIRRARRALTEQSWHLTPPEERETVLCSILPGMAGYQYAALFGDFRNGGYRVLGDILCDLDDLHRQQGVENHLIRKGDSKDLKRMLHDVAYGGDYREAIISGCLSALRPPDAREPRIDFTDAAKCAVALGKRRFALEVLPAALLELTKDTSQALKKRRWFRRGK